MAKPTGFLENTRELPGKESPQERIKHYNEFYKDEEFGEKIITQASRCMDCGVPFCHNGCPLGNIIPEFNDAVYRKSWKEAFKILSSTNNFPEFTGRICPAPCESACVLGINQPAITIENIEKNIIEEAYKNEWVQPKLPKTRSQKKVAVIGSGPAGLAAAEQLNSAGHWVTVFERAEHVGGLVRYGIPDFKLEKWVVERKVEIMESAGIEFKTNAHVGVNIPVKELQAEFDAIVLAGGSTAPRDLPVPGRELKGVYFAMDFLSQNNSRVAGKKELRDHRGETCKEEIFVKDGDVVVIGGGDTGSDCVGTSNRHGAKSITQFEIMPKPPEERAPSTPWPNYPMQLKTSTSHEEGCERAWSVTTKEFIGENGLLTGLRIADVEWVPVEGGGRPQLKEVEGSERVIPANYAFLAMGFLHPERKGMIEDLGVDLDERGNVLAHDYATSVEGVFTAGDMRRGQSLVVWAISEGRECAVAVDKFLSNGVSKLEKKADSLMLAH